MEQGIVLLILILLGVCETPAVAEPISPNRFMQKVFETRYQMKLPVGQAREDEDSIFDLPLKHLLRPDRQTGERAIDFDPVCYCQDFNITGVKVGTIASDARASLIEVRFVNGSTVTKLRYVLRHEHVFWKISDIIYPGRGSLIKLLGGKPPHVPNK